MDASDSPALDPEHCYPALQARDARFDGLWFVGVTSTGIYCRPVCRVRTPRRDNCRFFASAAQAEAAQFRPCLKCRPETAPAPALRWSVMDASRSLAVQAAWLLDQGRCESVQALAARLGISDRHLRRIFLAHHGVAPLQYLQTRRLLLAKQLLADSDQAITEIAAAAGFGSLRRFNDAFVRHYRLQPSAMRRGMLQGGGETQASLRLAFRPPYAMEAMLQFLAARAIPGVETVDLDKHRISRSLRLTHAGRPYAGRITLRFDPARAQLLLTPDAALWPACASLIPLVRRWLDLDAQPQAIDQGLGALAHDCPGLRLPGCTDRFELAVRAVLGQQITVAGARTLGARFVQRFGQALAPQQMGEGVDRLFPQPEQIASLEPSNIAELGIIRQRAEALIALARAWPQLRYAQGPEGMAGMAELQQALSELQALPGIGPWTANYMLMRGWSWPDIFPPGDVVLRKQLAERPAGTVPQDWQPYRSYAVLQLWRQAAMAPRPVKNKDQ
ncbi:MAG: DNA-3-methyladenine glycosylase 2 family protein [Roseateles sp.]